MNRNMENPSFGWAWGLARPAFEHKREIRRVEVVGVHAAS